MTREPKLQVQPETFMAIKALRAHVVSFGSLKPGDKFLFASDHSLSRPEESPQHLPMVMCRTDDSDPEMQWEPVFRVHLPERPNEMIAGGSLGSDTEVIRVR